MDRLGSLNAWTCARHLARDAYLLTMRKPLCDHFRLSDQIRGAASSIPANIAEGYGLGTRAQFVRCLRISLAESYELRRHLELAIDCGLVPAGTEDVRSQCRRVSGLLIGLLKRLGSRMPPRLA